MPVMRIKLIQNGIVDSTDRIERLDCAGLSARDPWSITVNFGAGDVCIANVDWTPSAAYAMRLVCDGRSGKHYSRLSHCSIVPGVLGLLAELFREDGIYRDDRTQPVVQVAPIG